MTFDPTTIETGTSLKDALELIRSQPFRHLPVVDEAGKLAGIVTEKDLVYASPSSDLTLSVFEIDYLLSRMSVDQVMKENVVTISPGLPIEEAARVMVDHRIGCLPVVEDDHLIGIISDTDIFQVFVEGLGGGHPSLRITVVIPEEVGSLARTLESIASLGGNIHTLGTFWGEMPEDRIIALRVEGVESDVLIDALRKTGIEVSQVWQPADE
jgi:acetoin utilization protein AcuB